MGRNAQKSTKTTKGVDPIDDIAIYIPLAPTQYIQDPDPAIYIQ